MNRSLRMSRSPVSASRRGQILIATSFEESDRGVIWVSAAPWLAATLAAEIADHGRVITGEAPAPGDGSAGKGVMLAASYLDRGRTPGGFALVVHPADSQCLAIAERAASQWCGVLRSRRILVADQPRMCSGGERALRILDGGTRDAEPLFVLHKPVAPLDAVRRLERSGAVFADDLDAVPEGATVAVPSYGAPLAVRAEAAARGLRLLDATCPLVSAAHKDAAEYAGRGDTVLVIGRGASASLPVLAAQAGDAAVLVPDIREAQELRGIDPDRVSFVIDPAMRSDEALRVVAALRRRFPKLRGHHFGAVCDAAADQANAVGSVARASELMLVLTGDHQDPGTRTLLAICRQAQAGRTVAVRSLTDITADLLSGVTTVGLASTLSAPDGLEEKVIAVLSGLGPLSLARREFATQPEQVASVHAGTAGAPTTWV